MVKIQFFIEVGLASMPLIGGILLLIFSTSLLSQVVGVLLCVFGVGFIWYMVWQIGKTLEVKRRFVGYGDLK